MRTAWLLGISTTFALLTGLAAVGCGGSSGGSGGGSTQAAVSSGTTGGASSTSNGSTTSGTPAVYTLEPNGSLGFELRAAIARDFAPQLRYNAYYNDGNGARQNRNEDFFPIGVASLLKQLNAQQVRLVIDQSTQATPALLAVQSITDQASFGAQRLEPYPRFIAGDQPGTAPL
ncbi:MAG: hypothetical protein KDD82_18880, partial [Planctomycetes bacterium]|nr:hypothetical protein [Planctomycetota bacterium]